jgi:hypothetical protein
VSIRDPLDGVVEIGQVWGLLRPAGRLRRPNGRCGHTRQDKTCCAQKFTASHQKPSLFYPDVSRGRARGFSFSEIEHQSFETRLDDLPASFFARASLKPHLALDKEGCEDASVAGRVDTVRFFNGWPESVPRFFCGFIAQAYTPEVSPGFVLAL